MSGADFVREMLEGQPTYGINFDRIQWDNKHNTYLIIELLLCEESQSVTPHTSHPNRYFYKNKQKFISLWDIAGRLNANLLLINYARKGTKHQDKILLMHVQDVNSDDEECPVKTKDHRFYSRADFGEYFRELNLRGRRI
jgi:hypothetical protein